MDDKTLLESELKSLDDVSFGLALDSNNLLRCVLNEEKSEFVFYAEEDLEKISLAIRNYRFDGEISFDGDRLFPKKQCKQLKKGLNELYASTDPFDIKKGFHRITRPGVLIVEKGSLVPSLASMQMVMQYTKIRNTEGKNRFT